VSPVRAGHCGCPWDPVRVEFFWTQLHKLTAGISVQNAEILFPLGAFALLAIAAYYLACGVLRLRQPRVAAAWLCAVGHLAIRGPVDFYLVTSHSPFQTGWYWRSAALPWRLLAFAGGLASVAAISLQTYRLIRVHRQRRRKPGGHAETLGANAGAGRDA
jgi:hypothetical protein